MGEPVHVSTGCSAPGGGKERPILFSAPMVRAILEGRKTQTRRVVKGNHLLGGPPEDYLLSLCPYGQPGDRLWVRETWCSSEKNIVGYRADARCGAFIGNGDGGMAFEPHGYIIDSPAYHECFKEPARTCGLGKYGGKWRPSIHMPRWASRILLEIVAVRVERLNDISEKDAIAEGIGGCLGDYLAPGQKPGEGFAYADGRGAFRHLWEAINGTGSWAENPWVWVVEFRRAENA